VDAAILEPLSHHADAVMRRFIESCCIGQKPTGPQLALTTAERAEVRQLKRVRMERGFLNKAAAFFAREDDSASLS
jgi:hypothetical protein